MTQPQRNEERLLDYLYGELDADSRAQVDAELSTDPALRAELESHRRVRTAFAELPKLEQSAESAQRMTALLMQQAAQGAAATKQADPVDAGGGKLLSFRSRTLRRVFTNPATGIFAAAAAALIWVAVKSQSPTTEPTAKMTATPAATSPNIVTVPTAAPVAPTTGSPSADPAVTKTVATADSKPAAEAGGDAPAQVWAQLSRSAASNSLAQAPETVTRPDPAAPVEKPVAMRAGRDKAKDSLDGKAMALNEGYTKNKGALAKSESAPPKADRAFDDYRREAESPAPAAKAAAPTAPSPSAPPSATPAADSEGGVRGAIAQTQARRNQRIIEDLANQELGAMPAPSGGAARPSSPPPPPPPAAAAPAEAERYAQNDVAEKSAVADEEKKNSYSNNARSRDLASSGAYAQNQGRSQSGPAQRVDNLDGDRNNLPLLQAVQEYLRQGRCAEANAALVRVEQSFPATRGLSEARAQWQKSCSSAPGGQAVPNQERQMLAQPNESQQPAPMAAPAPMPRSMKKAAPARAKPAPAKAADSAAAY